MIYYTKYISDNSNNREWITFVHGAGGSSTIWFKQIKYFSKKYNLLLLDLRGHGKSKTIPMNPFKKKYTFNSITADILEVLDKENIIKSHFVGISLGTILIRNFAEKYPVIIDCTHSVQAPGGLDGKTGGERRFAPTIAYAAYATGYCDGVFMEVHNDPDNAPSDGPNMIHIDDLNAIVSHLKKLHDINSPSTPTWEPPYTPEGPKTWEQLQIDYDRFDG